MDHLADKWTPTPCERQTAQMIAIGDFDPNGDFTRSELCSLTKYNITTWMPTDCERNLAVSLRHYYVGSDFTRRELCSKTRLEIDYLNAEIDQKRIRIGQQQQEIEDLNRCAVLKEEQRVKTCPSG